MSEPILFSTNTYDFDFSDCRYYDDFSDAEPDDCEFEDLDAYETDKPISGETLGKIEEALDKNNKGNYHIDQNGDEITVSLKVANMIYLYDGDTVDSNDAEEYYYFNGDWYNYNDAEALVFGEIGDVLDAEN